MTQASGNGGTAAAGATRALHFCMVTTFYPPYNFGGDGIFVQRLSHALAARGHQVTVVHCADAYRLGGGEEPSASITPPSGVEVHTLASGLGLLSPLLTHQFAVPGLKSKKLRSILERDDFDVIHFHNVSLVGGPGVLSYGSAVKLYTAHEYWLVCPLSTLWQMRTQPCDKARCVSCTVDAGRPPQWWRYTGNLERNLKHLDAMLAPSEFTIERHARMGLEADFTLLPNFLPDADASAATETSQRDRPFYLFAGRLEKTKGVQVLLEAFRNFDAADLLIVGAGPYESELRQMAAGLDHVEFTGQLPYETLKSLYRDAIATLVPSIWYEPFGLIVLESFAQGTPVIVNNAGALPELVQASGGGLVYDSVRALEDALKQLASDTTLAGELGERARMAFREHWTEEQHLGQYLGLVNQHLRQRGAA